jgi:hypothetical membrane protein
MKRSVRWLAGFAIAAQLAFVASWIVSGALQTHYSGARSGVSELAAHGMRHPWIVMSGLVVLGLGVAALAPGLRAVLPARRAAAVAVGLFVVAGAGLVVAGLARLDCDLSQSACSHRFEAGMLSWHTSLHVWVGLLIEVALVLTPFALAQALWPTPVAAASLGAGLTGIAIGGAASILYGVGAPDGVLERIELVVTNLWLVIVAAGILYETRGEPKLSAPAALRPRDFFGSAWSGDGVALGVPAFLWRRLGPRFTLTRETTWHSDEVAVVRDRAVLSSGRVEERVRFARFVDPSHIHVTSDDMPDGADITVDEQGYRIAPYRVLVGVGPLRLMMTSRDEASVESDGTLRYVARLSWHGLPVARLDLRARPVDTAPAPQSTAAALTGSA